MPNKRKWFQNRQEETTRSRSKKQETKVARAVRGYTTFNSGATFGENDVVSDMFEVECKTTAHASYSVKESDMEMLRNKCHIDKIPLFVVTLEKFDKTYALLDFEDLKVLIANQKTQ